MSDPQRQHELIQDLKQMAIELGRCPKRDEFGRKDQVDKAFGTFTVFKQAAGFTDEKPRKIDNSIFNKSIDSHLDEYKPDAWLPRKKPYPTIASISDIHWPFSNQHVINRFYEYVADVKPEHVVINGDAWDMYAHSRFATSHNVFTPREERARSIKQNTEFWSEIKRRHPAANCVQMLGNHCVRPLKRILEVYPAAEDWIEDALKRDFTFDGVKTVFDPREEFFVDDVAIFHGYRSGLGAHRDYTHMNTVNGHTHLGGVAFRRIKGQTLWELNSGLAGDPLAKGLTYTPQKTTHWSPGFGVVNKLGPQFIPV